MMNISITILFAYRNREVSRIRSSMHSLQQQSNTNFKVLFIDYGSDADYANAVKKVLSQFDFATYIYIGHTGLLWNKSKALNYGITQALTQYVVIADVDVLFTADFIETLSRLATANTYSLFKIGYLSEQVTKQQQKTLNLKAVQTTHIGDTFGIGLYPKALLETVGGLDEFFHFYGSEDEDLNARIEQSGAKLNKCNEVLLYHQWHPRYPQKKDNKLTQEPRLTNVLRLNQRHFLQNSNRAIVFSNHKKGGRYYKNEDLLRLKTTNTTIKITNIAAHVIHFLEEELPKHYKGIVEVQFQEDNYVNTIKYKAKKSLGKQTQPYLTMKAVNDLILRQIVFRYRHCNYMYSISENLKTIHFVIDLDSELIL
ncbi:MAG: glycosyltransferase [Gelidibacter sp.]